MSPAHSPQEAPPPQPSTVVVLQLGTPAEPETEWGWGDTLRLLFTVVGALVAAAVGLSFAASMVGG